MKFKATYDGNHDTFRVEFLVVPIGGLAFLVNHEFSPLEVRNLASLHMAFFFTLNVMESISNLICDR